MENKATDRMAKARAAKKPKGTKAMERGDLGTGPTQATYTEFKDIPAPRKAVKSASANRYGLDAQQERYAQLRASGVPPMDCVAQCGLLITRPGAYEARNPLITARIMMLQDEAASQVIEVLKIDKEVIARETWEMYQHCKTMVDKTDKFGNKESAPVRAGEALKALELLAKMEGLLVQKTEIRIGALDDLSDQELTRIAYEYAAAIGFDSSAGGDQAPAGPQQTIVV